MENTPDVEEPAPGADHATLAHLEAEWVRALDGETGDAFGRALIAHGDLDRAAEVYTQLIANDYLIGFYALAWLEKDRGENARAEELLAAYLDADTAPDEFADHVAGVLGHWRWHASNHTDAEPLLRRGADHCPAARADLAHLLKATGKVDEAEAVLRAGVAVREVVSFLPLANLLDESGRTDEAESLFREGYALGDAYSAYNLSLILDRDDRPEEAAEWLWKAAQGGDESAIRWLADQDI